MHSHFLCTALTEIMATVNWMKALIPITSNDRCPSYPKAIKRIDSNKIVFQKQGTLSGGPFLQAQNSGGCDWLVAGRSTPTWSTH